ncbi:MAG: MiaB/RimO family radical SAM methylthiotransferase [Gemmatimonadota bacterium]|nr:MiaB/RimO family radical SAM methylthiotransferase [Gemmatimonadota bacterium]
MKVYLRTYGCRANQYDTESVRALLAGAGIEETSSIAEADVAVFNSCTVTSEAEADLRSGVRAAARENPAIRTLVMGCAAGIADRDERAAPLATLPNVEGVIAGADIPSIAIALGVTMARPEAHVQSGARALLRIQDGCDEHCTFCATTRARGANRSRALDAIIAEALSLAEVHPEIVLTGIHIGSYGRDIRSSLGELAGLLVSSVPHVRFRLSSVEATEVDERLVKLFGDAPDGLAPHLHAPLQSGSDPVLRRMGRNWYDAASYERAVRRLTHGSPVFALSADVIAGFPGETEEDHAATLCFVDRLPFTSLHVFPYSDRPGTAAARLGPRVAGKVIRRRAAELRAVARDKATAYAASRAGGSCDVVVTERGKGLTEDYLSVAVPDLTISRRSRFRGTLGCGEVLTATPA